MVEPNVTLIIQGNMLIDGLAGPPVSPGLVAIAGQKIVYAGPAAEAPPFATGRKLVLSGACLLPGLIDMHVHPTYYWNEPDAVGYPAPDHRTSHGFTPAMISLLAAARLREALMAGVTTARDTGGVDRIIFDVKRAIDQGLIPGPKVCAAGRLIVSTGGHTHYRPGLCTQVDGPFGFRRAVREEIRAGADFIKLANRGRDMTQEELEAAVDEAHCLGKKVACHTNQPPSQLWAIQAGVDTFEHGTPSHQELDLAAEKGVAWTPTINVCDEYLAWCERHRQDPDPVLARQSEAGYADTTSHCERLRDCVPYAARAGVKVVAGTDSYMVGMRFAALADEMCALASYGLSPMQAIQAATLWPAQVMGWSDVGSLEAGKRADVIAVAGDPLRDLGALNHVDLVVHQGEIVKAPAVS